MMTERDRINSINYARQEGREEGREEGLMEGLMEGELKKQHEIASALKAKGIDVGTISVCTGLSLDEVAKL
jgi:predicted transposase/invertase (TIGR01784 family)